MADKQSWSQRVGLTRGKLALIAVLAVVLVGVVYVQYGPTGGGEARVASPPDVASPPAASAVEPVAAESAPPTVARSSPAAPAAATDGAASQAIAPRSAVRGEGAWRVPDVATVVRYDPFARPASFPQPAAVAAGDPQGLLRADESASAAAARRASELADQVARIHTELEALRQRGVHVIVRERDQYVALIGDRTVRVGDEINGFTVTAIEPDGVRVERKVIP